MRTTKKAMSITLAILSLVAGSLAQEIKTDYDRKADFSHYKTFSFEKVETKDPLWVDRITAAIGRELTAKGLTQVASGGDIATMNTKLKCHPKLCCRQTPTQSSCPCPVTEL